MSETFILNVRDPESVIEQLARWLDNGTVTAIYIVPENERDFTRADKGGRDYLKDLR